MAQVCLSCNRESPEGRFSCQHCGASFVTAAPTSSNGGMNGRLMGWIGVGVVVLLGVFGVVALMNRGGAAVPSASGQSRTAYEVCKRGIEGQLVAPATAVFPAYDGVVAEREGQTHRFTGEVDSENRMGVPIRATFVCAVEESADGGLKLADALVLER